MSGVHLRGLQSREILEERLSDSEMADWLLSVQPREGGEGFSQTVCCFISQDTLSTARLPATWMSQGCLELKRGLCLKGQIGIH